MGDWSNKHEGLYKWNSYVGQSSRGEEDQLKPKRKY